jgi:DNA-binding NarL/FixJ family response regulator
VKTAEAHRINIMRKLNAQSVVDLVKYAMRNNMLG